MGMKIWGVMLAFVGVLLLMAALGQAGKNRAFRGALPIMGTVVHKRRVRRNNVYGYILELAYQVDGVSYTRDVGVLAGEFDACDIGGQYEILYRPDKPKKIIRPQDASPRNVKVLLLLGAALTAAGAVLFLLGSL